jgi:hypothetical protein
LVSSSSSYYDVSGVRFDDTATGSTQNVNGNFSLSPHSSGSAYGVYFESTARGARTGTPTFYCNIADSGNWKSNGGSEN